MIKNDSLYDVEISNFSNDEEINIIADIPSKDQFGAFHIFYFILLISTILFSSLNILQNQYQINANAQEIDLNGSTWTHNLKSKINNISPQMSSFLLTVILSTPILGSSNNSIGQIFNNNQFLKFKPFINSEIDLLKDNQHIKFLNSTLLNTKIIDSVINEYPNNQINRFCYIVNDKVYFIFDLFYSEFIAFDALQINIKLYGKVSNNEKLAIMTKTKNASMNLILSIFRTICSLVLINDIIYSIFNYCNFHLFSYISNDNNFGKNKSNMMRSMSIEIFMTIVLNVLCLLYVDPLFLFHYFLPSSFHLRFKVAFRDLFFSYLFFYSIQIFDYFERKKVVNGKNSEVNSKSNENEYKLSYAGIITLIISIIILAILFIQNTKMQSFYSVYPKVPFLRSKSDSSHKNNFNFQSNSFSESEFKLEFGQFANRLNAELDSLNLWHFIFLGISSVFILSKIYFTYFNAKRTFDSNRHAYYSITTLSLLVMLVAYSFIRIHFFTSSWKTIPIENFHFSNSHNLSDRKNELQNTDDNGDYCFVNESFFCLVFPMVIFTIYSTFMTRGHRFIENAVSEFDQYNNPNLEENSLIADVDELQNI